MASLTNCSLYTWQYFSVRHHNVDGCRVPDPPRLALRLARHGQSPRLRPQLRRPAYCGGPLGWWGGQRAEGLLQPRLFGRGC